MKILAKVSKFNWLHSLRTRFVLLISAVLILIFGLIAFFLISNARATLTSNQNNEVKAFSALSVQPIGNSFITYQNSGSILINQQMQKFTALDPNVSNIAVVGLNGQSQFSLNSSAESISTNAASNFASTTSYDSKGLITRVVEPYFDDSGVHSYAVVYTVSATSVEHAIAHDEYLILIFAILGLFVSALATYIFIDNFFLMPIEVVNSSAQIIASGYYNEQIEYDRRDEIGTLASSLNRMATALKADINKLEEVDKLKTEFITIASHNLRTPISIIQGYVDMLKTVTDPQAKKSIDSIGKSASTLSEFTEQMLTIADIDSIRSAAFLEDITLTQLLTPLSSEFAQIAQTKGLTFNYSLGAGDTHINANQRQLASAIKNVLDNAVKFTEKGGSVTLESSADSSGAQIKVTDTGIGIDQAEFPKMFTKFHRGTDTLHYNYPGVGIGLYVSRIIIEQHAGSISFQSQLGKGSTFIIRLPIQQPKPDTNPKQVAAK